MLFPTQYSVSRGANSAQFGARRAWMVAGTSDAILGYPVEGLVEPYTRALEEQVEGRRGIGT